MTIRPLTTADIPALRALAIRIYSETFGHLNSPENLAAFIESDYSVARFEEEFRQPGSLYYFAEEDGNVLGYLRLRDSHEVDHLLGPNTIELHRIYVDGQYHGMNVGNALMEFAINIAKEKKVDWLWLGVWEKNPRAQRFYERWGFEKFSEHIFQMGDDAQTDWLLRKKI